MASLAEQYRPRTWADVVAQDTAIRSIQTVARRGYSGRAWWIHGKSGTGKTTLAYLIAAEIADLCVEEMDGSELTLPELRRIERDSRLSGMGKLHGRAVIINESHGLRADVVRRLLVVLERIPSHVAWLFTTTVAGHDAFEGKLDAHPLLSRCTRIALSQRDLCKPFAARAKAIARAEGLDGRPLSAYERLAKDCGNSLRDMLSRIESGAMSA